MGYYLYNNWNRNMQNIILREPLLNPKESQAFGKDFKVWIDGKEMWFYKERFGLSGGHPGIDYGCNNGTPIYASNDGEVLTASFDNINGNFIQVWNKEQNFKTVYGHLSVMKVKQGDVVVAGQLIGLSGNTGDGTGPHLHFGLKPTTTGGNGLNNNNGTNGAIDPAPYIKLDYKGKSLNENDMVFKKIKGEPNIYLVDDVKGTKMMIVDMETLNALGGEIQEVPELAGYIDKGTLIWVNRIIN